MLTGIKTQRRCKLSLGCLFQIMCETKVVHCRQLLINLKVGPLRFSQSEWDSTHFESQLKDLGHSCCLIIYPFSSLFLWSF